MASPVTPHSEDALAIVPAPREEYTERLELRRRELARLDVWENVVGLGRVVSFLAAAVIAWLAWGQASASGWWVALPLGVFVVLLFVHDRILRECRRLERAVAWCEAGLARLDDRWRGQGIAGERFRDERHPCVVDLDLFGVGSLFERLCQARTRAGEDALASWLAAPASAAEVRARQEAVAELRGRLDLREQFACAGGRLEPGVDFREVVSWGAADALLWPDWPRWFFLPIGLLTLWSCAEWLLGRWSGLPFAVLVLVELGLTAVLGGRVHRVLRGVDRRAHDLNLLACLLECLEKADLRAARLRDLQERLRHRNHPRDAVPAPPSQQIAKLANLVELLHSRRNQFFLPIACVLMWGTQIAYALEAWRSRHGRQIAGWLDVVAQFEALGSLATYAFENPGDPFPEVMDGPPTYQGEALGHPLLPRARCVCNDLTLGDELRLLIVSGSNMSGKSTFLRTVGVNAVLALAGAPVRARRLRLSPLVVGATLRIQDSLEAGISRFYAEVLHVRQIVELASGPLPLLFLLDELFAGTNSHDRRIGAEAVVRGLVEAPAIGLVTTHDLALTQIAEQLAPHAANVHFADHFENGKMTFDYRLRPGVVQHSNALALMRAVGLKV
jgi:hypothetical protein